MQQEQTHLWMYQVNKPFSLPERRTLHAFSEYPRNSAVGLLCRALVHCHGDHRGTVKNIFGVSDPCFVLPM